MLAGRWRYATGYVRGFVSGVREYRRRPSVIAPEPTPEDDPDVLLMQALQGMRETQAKNRERAVQAITAKNNLQVSVDQTEKIVNNLRAKADKASLEGNQPLADELRAEKVAYEASLADMTASLASANETVERVKVAIRREEERVRTRTARAMALKAQWKQHQILENLNGAGEKDNESVLRPMRAEMKALLGIVRRVDADLQEEAQRAMQRGNIDLAQGILAERGAFRRALSA